MEKTALRRQFSAYREELGEAEYARRSAAITARVKTLPEILDASTVHVYWPLLHRREVDTRPLIAWLQSAGKQIVLPVVRTFGKATGRQPRLRHLYYHPADTLRPNRWGIYEPSAGKSVPLSDIDAVIVPAFGAGRDGHRLGHGHGYYDEFLRTIRVPRIGLVYAACLVECVPAGPHDVPLSVLITEDEILHPTPRVTSSPG